jgi:RNA polymerase sigma-70 factor (ECF subfamily)
MKLLSSKHSVLTDELLMQKMSSGDKRAFDELYNRYSGLLLAYFMRMLWKDREKAEDFLHDLFTKLIHKPEYFDPTRSFKTWIYSVANNMCKNEYKRQEVRKGMVNGLDNYYSLSDRSVNVMGEVQDAFFQEAFERSLERLDQKHREAFILRHLEGLSIKEISETLNANEGTIKSRIFYAVKYLAESLKEFDPLLNR